MWKYGVVEVFWMRWIFIVEEKVFVFELWKNGIGFSEIVNILGLKFGMIFIMLRDIGGIKFYECKWVVVYLILFECEEIWVGLLVKMSICVIVIVLNCSFLMILCEV